ncbi:MAG: hypothetical protein K0S33_51 [Bacteroidetes bacterium]|nr:hypothetical protein [Bacteroidota bacterium]
MKLIATVGLFLLLQSSFAQIDVIKVVKQENNTILFASVLDQIVSAKATKEEISNFGKIYVNDSIVVSSYWFTCFANGVQHQRLESGPRFSGQTMIDLNHIGKGGKAYFTNITGYSIYTHIMYKIYNLEILITD